MRYDRAGLGWSDGALTPRTVANMVAELAAALDAANINPPYVLAAHSFGCLLTALLPAPIPIAPPLSSWSIPSPLPVGSIPIPQQLRRLNMGARLSRRGAWLARFGVVRAALSLLVAGGTRIP